MPTLARTLMCRCHRAALTMLLVALLPGVPVAVAEVGDGWPAWVDEHERLRERIADVNEGELRFLDTPVDAAVHVHDSRVVISEESLRSGWVRLDQCHDNLDRVAAAQIVFNPERSRALRVTSFRNIDAAFAEGHTVQLRNIGAGSQVCISAQSRALQSEDGVVFVLHNGPFMRRFLDGYYPLQLSLRIDYPSMLDLADFSPEVQPGFDVRAVPGSIRVDSLFEGQLHTRFRFLTR